MSPTVVVADDSQTIRRVVQMALKAEPFEVVGVENAQEAVDAAQRSPSVLLLDYHLPDGSGYEVCQAIKSNGSTAGVPVIMLGGTYRDFDESKAREAGADEIVMKPFETDTLLNAIDAVAEGGQQAAAAGAGQQAGGQQAQQGQQVASAGQPSAPAGQSGPPPRGGEAAGGQSSSGSRPRMSVDQESGPRQPPSRDESGSKPRFRQPDDSASQPRIPDSGSQPRIPDSGSQPGAGGSQPRISTPDVNASTRAQNVAGAGEDDGGVSAGGDSGVSNIGMSRAEIEKTIDQKVKRTVKEQLPGLLRNIMGEVFQEKVLPKLMEHGEHRVEALVNDQLSDQIRDAVRVEIERLLAEE
ncbi:MAG: response regulator [Persicimonas sp.]